MLLHVLAPAARGVGKRGVRGTWHGGTGQGGCRGVLTVAQRHNVAQRQHFYLLLFFTLGSRHPLTPQRIHLDPPSTCPLHLPRGLASAQLLPVGGAENQPIQKNHTSLAQRFFFFFSSLLVSSSRFSFYGTRCALVPVCTRSWESHNVEFS